MSPDEKKADEPAASSEIPEPPASEESPRVPTEPVPIVTPDPPPASDGQAAVAATQAPADEGNIAVPAPHEIVDGQRIPEQSRFARQARAAAVAAIIDQVDRAMREVPGKFRNDLGHVFRIAAEVDDGIAVGRANLPDTQGFAIAWQRDFFGACGVDLRRRRIQHLALVKVKISTSADVEDYNE